MPDDPQISYLDGREVAYSVVGSGQPLVLCGWWSSNLVLDWQDEAFRSFVAPFAQSHAVVRYDRSAGGSGELAEEAALVARLVARLRSGPATVVGIGRGALVAIALAAQHPESVDRLVLYGSFRAGAMLAPAATLEAARVLIGSHWEIASRVIADVMLADADPGERADYARRQRRAQTRARALATLASVAGWDVSDDLPRVDAPTLVVHRRQDQVVAIALGREVADSIEGALFLPLDGREHLPWRGESDEVVRAALGFLGVRLHRRTNQPPGAAHLSVREADVLRLVARGMTDTQIAGELVLSAHTVHRHVANARLKLGVSSRAAAAAWAAHNGLF